MPKLKPTEKETLNRNFRILIKSALFDYELNIVELGQRLGHSASTTYRRFRNPEEFTVADIRKMSKILHLSKDEIWRAIE